MKRAFGKVDEDEEKLRNAFRRASEIAELRQLQIESLDQEIAEMSARLSDLKNLYKEETDAFRRATLYRKQAQADLQSYLDNRNDLRPPPPVTVPQSHATASSQHSQCPDTEEYDTMCANVYGVEYETWVRRHRRRFAVLTRLLQNTNDPEEKIEMTRELNDLKKQRRLLLMRTHPDMASRIGDGKYQHCNDFINHCSQNVTTLDV